MIVDVTESNKASAVDAIAALEAELFGRGAWNANMVREELDAPARTYVLDVDDAAASSGAVDAPASSRRPERAERAEGPHVIAPASIRGYAGFWYDGEDSEIMTIGVAKEHQRRGIAAAMLTALIVKAREQGARRMLLEVRVDNEPALALYRRFGFERMGLRKRYYQPEGIDAYTMSLDLVPRIVGFAAPASSDAPLANAPDAPDATVSNVPAPTEAASNASDTEATAPHAITNATTNSITNGKTR